MSKETEKQINDLIMAMAKDPQNIENYHKLSELFCVLELDLESEQQTGEIVYKDESDY